MWILTLFILYLLFQNSMGVNVIDLPDSSESDSNYREFIKRRDLNYNTQPEILENITISTKLYPYGNKTAPLRPEHTSLVYFSYPPGAPGESMSYKLPDRPKVPGGPIVVTDKQGNIVVTTTALPEQEEEEEEDEDDLDRQRTMHEQPTTEEYIELDTKDKDENIKRKIRKLVSNTLHDTAIKIIPLNGLKVQYYQNSYDFGVLFSAVKKAKGVLNEQFNSVVNHFHTRNSLELLKMYEQLSKSNQKNTILVRSLVKNVEDTGW